MAVSCPTCPPRPTARSLVFGPRSLELRLRPRPPADAAAGSGRGSTSCGRWARSPSLEPEPAADAALETVHLARVRRRRCGGSPPTPPAGRRWGSASPTTRRSPGMHEAGAAVADGSLRAMEAILRGDVEHALHPGGGLHHAMPDKAWGFCIYNDPALAVVRARAAGLRVLYVDLDTHHGDGVEAMFARRSGRADAVVPRERAVPVPGDRVHRRPGGGRGRRARRSTCRSSRTRGRRRGWRAVRSLVPTLAAAFGPDVIVSQHGADTHAWDPLAHLRVTTTAMGEAARLVDEVAHRWAGGRWLATGGGGYDAYRVVPRAWALTWLAGAHREAPAETPDGVAGAVGGRGGGVRDAGDAVDVRGRAERRASGRRRAGGRGGRSRWRSWPASARSCCRGWCARRRTAAGGRAVDASRSPSAPAPVGAAPPVIAALGAAELASLDARRAGRQPVRRRPRPGRCSSRRRATGRGSSGRSPGRRWSAWRSRPRTGELAGPGRRARPSAERARRRRSSRSLVDGRPPGTGMRRDGRRRRARLGRAARRRAAAGHRPAPARRRRASSCGVRRPDLARDDPWAVTARSAPADSPARRDPQRQPRSGATNLRMLSMAWAL